MSWGVWASNEDVRRDHIHVAPSDGEGNLTPPHILSDGCPCQPEITEEGFRIHNELKGGVI